MTPLDTGIVQTFNLSPRQQDDNFGFRFTGFIEVPLNGLYTFYTSSDDGSLLFIDNDPVPVVNNNGQHGMQESSGIIYLDAGMHSITVEYFERGGEEGLSVKYEGPGIPKQTIPYDVLCSSTITNEMQGQMQYNNASLWARIEFEVEDILTVSTLRREMRPIHCHGMRHLCPIVRLRILRSSKKSTLCLFFTSCKTAIMFWQFTA
jgi:hypothetical protein